MEIVHTPVLQGEIFEYLVPSGGNGLFIDATLGEGGHAEYFLTKNAKITIAGIDADESIMNVARGRLEPFGDRVLFFQMFSYLVCSYISTSPTIIHTII